MNITLEELQATIRDNHIHWQDLFDERQKKEIELDRIYADQFSHGTDGHNARLIIARMAATLDAILAYINPGGDGK